MKHIYIHFPFCIKKCHYCDFNSVACASEQIPHDNYAATILAELDSSRFTCLPAGRRFHASRPIESIFFGGGTPSLMRPGDVERILNALQKKQSFAPNIEITLEVNPGSVHPSKLAEFRAAGVNRFSIGVQSFDDENLKWFGRVHSADEARQMVKSALALKAVRVSLDLIYGFPNQTVEDWKRNLEEAVALGVKHASCYALTMPECGRGDPCGRPHPGQAQGLPLHELNDVDVAANMQEKTYEFMKNAGLPAYEISNFAVPGEESRHNLGYWRYEDFWGLGAGAVSQGSGDRGEGLGVREQNFVGAHLCVRPQVIRQTNFKDPTNYIKAVVCGEKYYAEELIDKKTAMFEFMMMGLRTREGILVKKFQQLFGESMEQKYSVALQRGLQKGWLRVEKIGDTRYAPTVEGFLLNNQLIGKFI